MDALERLDGARLRRTRGWRTARQDDAQRAHWSALVSREEVLERASCRIAAALLHSNSGRARRRAIREAILGALEECSVITRTRGGRPETAQCAEVFS